MPHNLSVEVDPKTPPPLLLPPDKTAPKHLASVLGLQQGKVWARAIGGQADALMFPYTRGGSLSESSST